MSNSVSEVSDLTSTSIQDFTNIDINSNDITSGPVTIYRLKINGEITKSVYDRVPIPIPKDINQITATHLNPNYSTSDRSDDWLGYNSSVYMYYTPEMTYTQIRILIIS